MKLSIYQVDAFAEKVFTGNPAAVCPLEKWLPDEILLNIAAENNLSETAFYVPNADGYEIRWFTPLVEVDLCGHATFAAAFVLFMCENHVGNVISFTSPRSGKLIVKREADQLTLDFPTDRLEAVKLPEVLQLAFKKAPKAVFKGKTDFMLVFEDEETIERIQPPLAAIASLPARGVIITALGTTTDFVSRFFSPATGVNEDPVTGSTHTTLIPYWASQLKKEKLTARQLSKRSGYLECTYKGDRVEIAGYGKLYLKGEIYIS